MRRALALLLVLTAGGCAYYNGLYNARGLVRRAESAARDGRDSAAVAAWRDAAAKADTVIARYPRSRWTDDALLLSGTSSAFSGACAHGMERLAQWERHPDADAKQRARATVARGACLVRLGENGRALDTLSPFVRHRDESLSRIAAAWAARAALANGLEDSVAILARHARSDALDSELASAALTSSRSALAVRILRQRASQWRSLDAMHSVLEVLARLNRAAADSVIQLTQRGRASRLERARLSVLAGGWAERAGDIHAAQNHYHRAVETTSDTALVTEATTRLGLLEMRTAVTIADARALLDRARGTALSRGQLTPVDSALRLAAVLASADDSTGASLFLAAEVARDAVGSRPLARALFLRAARSYPASSLAPKAWLAAADLTPDSAATWRAKVRTAYGASPYAQTLDGNPTTSEAMAADERLLRQAWARATTRPDSARVAPSRRVP